MLTARDPYLSLVVTARNDDHGGNLLGRMQAFVDGWIAQARQHRIPSEIVIVEWNPPADKPRLIDALDWPDDFGPCDVRIIEVPPALHHRYGHADALPLYQMIAKNVGIRRARGKFVLATNIDILFSDELAAFLARQSLEPKRMYRIDRHDAMSDVPVGAPLQEQLAYCRSNLIRVNRREGTFSTSVSGLPVLDDNDVAATGSGILFGDGWLPSQSAMEEIFRWALESAELLLDDSAQDSANLLVDLAPGPGMGSAPLDLEVTTEDGRPVTRLTIDRRTSLHLHIPRPRPNRLLFRAHGANTRTLHDPRVLSFRAFRIEWDLSKAEQNPTTPSHAAPSHAPRQRLRLTAGWAALQHVIAKLANDGPLVQFTVPVSPRVQRVLQTYVRCGGFSGMVRRIPDLFRSRPPAPCPPNNPPPADFADFLHTNACGDFTLMAREHWFDLRGYAEFDLFSMNLDSLFCFAAHCGGVLEEVLPEPMRIYHIEHGSGSGWTPEGQAKLFERIKAIGLSFMDNAEVLTLAAQMRSLGSPMIFNREDWGMADIDLQECSPLNHQDEDRS